MEAKISDYGWMIKETLGLLDEIQRRRSASRAHLLPRLPFRFYLAYRVLPDKLEAGMTSTEKIDLLLVEDEPVDIYLIERAIADCSPHVQV